jgi:D-xylose 1-dehydrogenase (NADP+, D-xylono-1,5-lactone-forming)
MAEHARVQWGILGDAAINDAFIPGVQAATNSELVALASRRPEAGANAASRWSIPRIYNSYDALLADSEIDAVYIPLPNHLHAEWTVRAADAGKHVLCEKPLALSVDEIRDIERAAARNHVQVMEAFMYRFLPRWRKAEELVWSGAIGDPRIVRIGFAFYHPPAGYNIRFDPEVGGGIIWDMGCYAVNMSRMLLRAEPIAAYAVPHSRSGAKVETSVEMILRFPDDRSSLGHVSFDYANPYSQADVVGTEGWISLPGTGFRREPATYLLHHHYDHPDDEIFLHQPEPESERFPLIDPYRLEAEHFADVIFGRTSLQYDLDDAKHNTEALLALHESARTGGEVRIEG